MSTWRMAWKMEFIRLNTEYTWLPSNTYNTIVTIQIITVGDSNILANNLSLQLVVPESIGRSAKEGGGGSEGEAKWRNHQV